MEHVKFVSQENNQILEPEELVFYLQNQKEKYVMIDKWEHGMRNVLSVQIIPELKMTTLNVKQMNVEIIKE